MGRRLLVTQVLSCVIPNMARQHVWDLDLWEVLASEDLNLDVGSLCYPEITNPGPNFAESTDGPSDGPFPEFFGVIRAVHDAGLEITPDPGDVVFLQPSMIVRAKGIPSLRVAIHSIAEPVFASFQDAGIVQAVHLRESRFHHIWPCDIFRQRGLVDNSIPHDIRVVCDQTQHCLAP